MAFRAPTLLNVAWTPKLGWDGHFRDLEAVAFGPITSPGNMNLTGKGCSSSGSRLFPAMSKPSTPPSAKATSPGKRSSWRWRHTSAPSCRAKRRSTAGSRATEMPIECSGKTRFRPVRRQGALRVLPQWLGLHRFVVPRHRHGEEWRLSGAANCFRLRSSCIMPSRRRRCATSRAARPTCTTVR